MLRKPMDYTCCEYEAVTFEEATAEFCEKTGLSESDIVGYELTYNNYEAEDHLIPAYIFYYVFPVAEQTGIWSGTEFGSCAVIAVRN